jgi:oxygen tolerance protein BatD
VRLAIAVVAICAAAEAQEISVFGPDPEIVRVGERSTVLLVADGDDAPSLGPLPAIDGVEIVAGAPQRSVVQSLAGGRIADRTRTTWEISIRPLREAAFEIPPLRVDAGGRRAATEPLRIEARADDADPRAFVEVVAERTTPFVGEAVRVRLRFGFERAFLERDVVPLFGRRLDVPVQLRARTLEDESGVGPDDEPDGGRRVTFALGERVAEAAAVEDRVDGGRTFAVFEIVRRIVPRASGALLIPAPHLRFAYATRFEESLIDGRVPADRREAVVAGRTLRLDVRPIPNAGRPAEFTGAVGRFTLAADATPRSAAVGESVKLALAFEGEGDLALFEPPSLADLDGFHVRGRIESTDAGGRRRTVTYDLAPLRAGAGEIPPIAFAWFDVRDPAGYRTLRTPAIPLDVRPSKESAAPSPAPTMPPVAEPAVAPVAPRASPRSLAPWLAAGALAAACVAAVALLVNRRARRSAPAVGARRPHGSAEAFRARAVDGELSGALSEYLAGRLGVPAAATIAPDLGARLVRAGVPTDLAARAAAALDALVAARYGSPDPGPGAAEIESLVAELDPAFERASPAR